MRELPDLVAGDGLCFGIVEIDVLPEWIRIHVAAHGLQSIVGIYVALGRASQTSSPHGDEYLFAFYANGYPTQQLVADLSATWGIPTEPFTDEEPRLIPGRMVPMQFTATPNDVLQKTTWFWFRIEDDDRGLRCHGSLCIELENNVVWIDLEDVDQREPLLELVRGVRTAN